MKKYLIIVLVLLFPFFSYAATDTLEGEELTTSAYIEGVNTTDTVEGQAIASGCDPCSGLGTAEFLWTGDYDADCTGPLSDAEKQTACVSGGTLQGDWSASAVISASQNHTSGGANSFFLDANGDRINFTITSKDIFDTSQGFIEFWVYYDTALTGFSTLFEAYIDSNNFLYISTESSGIVVVKYEGQGTQTENDDNPDVLVEDQWNKVEVRWHQGNNLLETQINTGDWVNDNDGDAMTAWTGEPSNFRIGEGYSNSYDDPYYSDDWKVWVTYDKS